MAYAHPKSHGILEKKLGPLIILSGSKNTAPAEVAAARSGMKS